MALELAPIHQRIVLDRSSYEASSRQIAIANRRMEASSASSIGKMANDNDKLATSLERSSGKARDAKGRFIALGASQERAAGGARTLARDVDGADRTLARHGRTADRTGSSVRGASNNFERLAKSLRRNQGEGSASSRVMALLGNSMKLLKFPAIITGVVQAGAALGGLTAAAVALVGALSPMVGVLAALPSLFAALATGAITAVLSFGGVGDALKAYSAQEKASGASAAAAGGQAKAAADAREAAARQVRDAEEALADAQRAAIQQVRSAEEALADAQEGARRAQEDLNEARQEAIRNLEDLRQEQERNTISVERAQLALEEARKRVREIGSDPSADSLDRRRAILDVRDAELDLVDARERRSEQAAELQRLERGGIAVDAGVIAARERLSEANDGVQDSQEALAEAIRSSNDAVVDAQQGLVDAQKALTEAGVSAGGAAGGVDKFAEAMAGLSPAAQSFVRTLIGLKPAVKDLRTAAAGALLPGLEIAVENLATLLPTLTPVITATGRAMGSLAVGLSEMFTTDAFRADLGSIGLANAAAFDTLGRAGLAVIDTFRNLMVAAQPMTQAIADLVLKGAQYVQFAAAAGRGSGKLSDFLMRALDTARQFGRIIADLSVGLFNLGRGGADTGRYILDTLEKVTDKFRSFTSSAKGKNAIGQFFEDARPTIDETGRLIRDIAKGFGNLFKPSPETTALIQQLRTELLPVIFDLLDNIKGGFAADLVTLITSFVTVFGDLAGTSGPLTIFVGTLTTMFDIVHKILDTVPGAQQFAITLGVIGGASKAFSVAGMLTGLGGLSKKLRGTQGLLGVFGDKLGLVSKDGQKAQSALLAFGSKVREGLGKALGVTGSGLSRFGRAAADAFGALRGRARQVADTLRLTADVARQRLGMALSAAGDRAKTLGTGLKDMAAAGASRLRDIGKRALDAARGFTIAGAKAKLFAVGQKIAAAATWLFNAALNANPIILIVTGLIALGAAIYLAYRNIKPFREFIDKLWQSIQDGWDAILPTLKTIGAVFMDAFGVIIDVAKEVIGFLLNNWRTILPIILGPIGLIIAHFDTFKSVAETVIRFVISVFRTLGPIIATVFGGIVSVISTVLGTVFNVIRSVLGFIMEHWDTVWGVISTVVGTYFRIVIAVVTTYINVVLTVIRTVIAVVLAVWNAAWAFISTVVGTVFAVVVALVTTYINLVLSIIQGVVGVIITVWQGLWDTVQGIIDAVWPPIVGAVQGAMDLIRGVISGAVGLIGAAWDAIKAVFVAPINWVIDNVINRFLDIVRGVAGALGFDIGIGNLDRIGEPAPAPRSGGGGGRVYPQHTGGVVGERGDSSRLGRTGRLRPDEELILAQQGEGVLPRPVMQKIGRTRFERLRRGETDILPPELGEARPRRAGVTRRGEDPATDWQVRLARIAGGRETPHLSPLHRGLLAGNARVVGNAATALARYFLEVTRASRSGEFRAKRVREAPSATGNFTTLMDKIGWGPERVRSFAKDFRRTVKERDPAARIGDHLKVRPSPMWRNITPLEPRSLFDSLVRRAGGHEATPLEEVLAGVRRERREREKGGPFDLVGDIVGAIARAPMNLINAAREYIAKAARPLITAALSGLDTMAGAFGLPGRIVAGISRKLGEGVLDWLGGVDEETGRRAPDLAGSGQHRGVGSGATGPLVDYMKGTSVPFRVTSSYRPGARTASGALSRHAMGLAVDFAHPDGPQQDSEGLAAIFRAFAPVEARLHELIYAGPQVDYNVKAGRRVGKYAQSIHHDHVHAAYDQGGLITRPTVGLLGETPQSRPEIVSPAHLMDRIVREAMRTEGGRRVTIDFHPELHVEGNVYGVEDLEETWRDLTEEHERRLLLIAKGA